MKENMRNIPWMVREIWSGKTTEKISSMMESKMARPEVYTSWLKWQRSGSRIMMFIIFGEIHLFIRIGDQPVSGQPYRRIVNNISYA